MQKQQTVSIGVTATAQHPIATVRVTDIKQRVLTLQVAHAFVKKHIKRIEQQRPRQVVYTIECIVLSKCGAA